MSFAVIDWIQYKIRTLYLFHVQGGQVKITLTNHAIQRMQKWDLSLEMVAETLFEPEDVLIGHHKSCTRETLMHR